MSARNASVIEADPFKIVVQLFRSVADDIDPAKVGKVFFAGSNSHAK
jgi:hypothetical protein